MIQKIEVVRVFVKDVFWRRNFEFFFFFRWITSWLDLVFYEPKIRTKTVVDRHTLKPVQKSSRQVRTKRANSFSLPKRLPIQRKSETVDGVLKPWEQYFYFTVKKISPFGLCPKDQTDSKGISLPTMGPMENLTI